MGLSMSPENREFNREFSGFSTDSALPDINSLSDFNALQPNSLSCAKPADFLAISMRCGPIP